ncbi:hypothetical protein C8Q76DRAFT_413555 [Earliella scabrosa]|nr:hypothetical protein C8Q76DRAFT_413555 [Earliella scabrosa]
MCLQRNVETYISLNMNDITNTINRQGGLRRSVSTPNTTQANNTSHEPNQQLQLVQVYTFALTRPPRLQTILVERHDGPEGHDRPRLDQFWSIDGRRGGFSATMRVIRRGRLEPVWEHYSVHYMYNTRTTMTFNEGLQALTDEGAPLITAEFVVIRTSRHAQHILEMRRVDRAPAEILVVIIARMLCGIEPFPRHQGQSSGASV